MSKAGKKIIEALEEAVSTDLAMMSFQEESNRIEGVYHTRADEVSALAALVSLPRLAIQDLVTYVAVCQPNARLRTDPGAPGVRVGRHIAPPSGAAVHARLSSLLTQVNERSILAWEAHCEYEDLHPFTDGNGRSGRALWLWMRRGDAPLGFLHQFYYETLEHRRGGD